MLSAVRCPSLGILGEAEGEVPRTHYETFLAGVSGKATGRIFTTQEGADAHCQVGNQRLLAAEVFDWLEDVRPSRQFINVICGVAAENPVPRVFLDTRRAWIFLAPCI